MSFASLPAAERGTDPAPAVKTEKKTAEKSTLGRKRWLLALFVFILVEAAVLAGVFDRLESSLYDAWFRTGGIHSPGRQVVVVAVDDASVQYMANEYGLVYPWPRSVYAGLLETLKEARVVGFDLLFDLPTKPEEDEALADAVKLHGRVILASMFSFEKNKQGEQEQVLLQPPPQLGAAGIGFVNMPTDTDGVVRHFTAADINFQEGRYYPFGLAVGMAAVGEDAQKAVLAKGRLKIGNRVIPLNDLNQGMPYFWGPQGTFKTYSFAQVLEGKIPAADFRDKIVLIGPTAPIFHDDKPTPYTTSNLVLSGNNPTPGVEIHASIVQSFLEGRWFRQANTWVNLAFLILAGILTTAVVAGRGPIRGLFGALAVITVYTALTWVSWRYGRLWINMGAPAALIFMTYAVSTAAEFVQAEIGRRRTRAMFSRYVSPAVADELMRDPDSVALGGRRQTVTVMFCDIRGFTSYSENKDPEEVVARLNEYLTVVTHIIFDCGGTLDKYLGDGLMAIFGAPVHFDDHVTKAISAALEIQRQLDVLNEAWAAKGAPPLLVGVGINSGSVLVGNVGSPERMDYTVIGEDVNLASRVEGLTKTFHTLITISERTIDMLDPAAEQPWNMRYLGQAEVKGFSVPIGVYTVQEKTGEEGA